MVSEIGNPEPNKECVELFEYMLEEAKNGQITAASVACVATGNSYYTQFVGVNRMELLAPVSLLAYRINTELEA